MKLKELANGEAEFQCPACGVPHRVSIQGPGAWQYTGTRNEPTLWPSVRWEGMAADGKMHVCHSFVVCGHIDFLTDCTHGRAKEIKVPLPEIDA